jgi:hypothetical protein
MLGISKFLIDKQITIKFEFDEPDETYNITGKSIDVEKVAERKDMVVLNVLYNDPVPMAYKVRLSDYLNTIRTDTRINRNAPAGDTPVASPAPSVPPAPAG